MKPLFFFLTLGLFSLIGCDHDHGDDGIYEVEINIVSPADGAKFLVNEAVPVKVHFTRADNKTIHHVYIDIVDDSGNSVKSLDGGHKHVSGEYEFESNTFVPTTTGAYKVFVRTTDDEEKQENKAERTFIVE